MTTLRIARVYDTVDPAGRRALFERIEGRSEIEVTPGQSLELYMTSYDWAVKCKYVDSSGNLIVNENDTSGEWIIDGSATSAYYSTVFPSDLTYVTLLAVEILDKGLDDEVRIELQDPGDYYAPIVFDAPHDFVYMPDGTTRWRAIRTSKHSKYWNSGTRNITLVNTSGGDTVIGIRIPDIDPYAGLKDGERDRASWCVPGWGAAYETKEFGYIQVYCGLYMPYKLMSGVCWGAPRGSTFSKFVGTTVAARLNWNARYNPTSLPISEGSLETPERVENCYFVNAPELRNSEFVTGCTFMGTSTVFKSYRFRDGVPYDDNDPQKGTRFSDLKGCFDRCYFAGYNNSSYHIYGAGPIVYAARISNCIFYNTACGFPARGVIINCAFVGNVSTTSEKYQDRDVKSKTLVINSYMYNSWLSYIGWAAAFPKTIFEDPYNPGNRERYGDDMVEAYQDAWVSIRKQLRNITYRRCVGSHRTGYDYDYQVRSLGDDPRMVGTGPDYCFDVGDDLSFIRTGKVASRYSATGRLEYIDNVYDLPGLHRPGVDPATLMPTKASDRLYCTGESIESVAVDFPELLEIDEKYDILGSTARSYNGVDRNQGLISIGPNEVRVNESTTSVVLASITSGFGSVNPRARVYAAGSDAELTIYGDVDSVTIDGESVPPSNYLRFTATPGIHHVEIATKRKFYVTDKGSDGGHTYGSSRYPLATVSKAIERATEMYLANIEYKVITKGSFGEITGELYYNPMPGFHTAQASRNDRTLPFDIDVIGTKTYSVGCGNVYPISERININFIGAATVSSISMPADTSFYVSGNNVARVNGVVKSYIGGRSVTYDPAKVGTNYAPILRDDTAHVVKYFRLMNKFVSVGPAKFVNCMADFSKIDELRLDGSFYMCDIVPYWKGSIDGTFVSCRVHDQPVPEWADGVLVGRGNFHACRIDRCRRLGLDPVFDVCYFTNSYNYTVTGSSDGKVYGNGNNEFDPHYRVVYPGSYMSSVNGDKEKVLTRNKRVRVSESTTVGGGKFEYVVAVENMPDIGDRASFVRLHTTASDTSEFDRPPLARPEWCDTFRLTDFSSIGFPKDTSEAEMMAAQQAYATESGFMFVQESDANFKRAVAAVMYYLASTRGFSDKSHMFDYINLLLFVALRTVYGLSDGLRDFAKLYVVSDKTAEYKNAVVSDFVRNYDVQQARSNIAVPFNYTHKTVDAAEEYVVSKRFENDLVKYNGKVYFVDADPAVTKLLTATHIVSECLSDLGVSVDRIDVEGNTCSGIEMPAGYVDRGMPVWTVE